MSRHTKEKRKIQKEKQSVAIERDKTVFDIMTLLCTEQLDTKPNMGKFLKTYVKEIRGTVKNGKMSFYPIIERKITKVIIRFLDGHELIFSKEADKP